MRVPTNSASNTVLAQLQKLSARQSQLQNQVSTGQRIFQPDDDPAAVGRVLALESERSRVVQFQRNATTAQEISQSTFASLKEIKKISDRAGELATLGAGAASPEAMKAYASEVNQLLEQGLQLANSRFRNDYLFAGTAVDAAPFTVTRDASGKIDAASFQGNGTPITVPLADSAEITPGASATTTAGVGAFLNQLVALRDALQAGDASALPAVQNQLADSESVLVGALSEQGAVDLRIEVAQSRQNARLDDIEKLVSSEADADLPSTVVRLSQATTAYEAALSSSSKILKMSLLDYLN